MIAGIILTLVCIGYRVAMAYGGHGQWWFDFAPISAIALCGSVYLPKRLAFILPLGALFLSDLILNAHYGASLISGEMAFRYLALAIVGVGGYALRNTIRNPMLLGGAALASLWFYLVTNTGSWLGEPVYAKTFAGWVQAQTTGVPGYPATYLFLRNSLLSDLLFTGLFLACMSFTSARKPTELYSESAETKQVRA
ncbi:MAG: hypothetical protein QM796_22370 [Chthoniobacteraceae bacterium]